MEKQTNLVIWVVAALVIGAILTAIVMPSKVETIAVASQCPIMPACNPTLSCPELVINISDVDTDWKQAAVIMATEEWNYKGFRPVFEVMKNIDEKEDISKVVIKTERVKSFDAFSQDAVVIQELKVYYEDKDGDDKKAFVLVKTTISNGEIDNQALKLS